MRLPQSGVRRQEGREAVIKVFGSLNTSVERLAGAAFRQPTTDQHANTQARDPRIVARELPSRLSP